MRDFLLEDSIDLERCQIESIGTPKIPSPLNLSTAMDDGIANYTSDEQRFVFNPTLESFRVHCSANSEPPSFEAAGPRAKIYFDPSKLRVAIVTCGGLCPGMNNVIRGLVMGLWYRYEVRRIFGVQYGFQGFIPRYRQPLIELAPNIVNKIHNEGGTVLGSSRGHQEPEEIVDALDRSDIQLLFTIGGDGTLRGSKAIHQEITRRGLKIAVIGVPKTIDNDIPYVEKTFGFDTAVSLAVDSIRAAHVEAKGAPNGIGLVRVMGRHSGYIAAQAALASREANLVLIPEQLFDLEGRCGIFRYLEKRIEEKGHAVVVVAEGAGQEHFPPAEQTDASGNAKLNDIGLLLAKRIREHFKAIDVPINLKYIDPSYIIRAAPAIASDSIFCASLATAAVHAGMAGKTGMVVGLWGGRFVHIPLELVTSGRKQINLDGTLWLGVVESTGQPYLLSDNHRKEPV
ncbi:MAG: ATP-dependent 6-phosphofructokinase [Myxococcales bacterium]|nr:ATP-dependent 6-phosphofructokinase [Myxococcales bacterium]